MLNNPEVPSSPMNRWLAHLKLYDFEVRHVSAKKHVLVDGLSRGHFTGEWRMSADEMEEERMMTSYCNVGEIETQWPWKDETKVAYEWKDLVRYLQTNNIPQNITYEDRRTLTRRAERFFLKDGKLWRKPLDSAGHLQEVLLEEARQHEAINTIHLQAHRVGWQGTCWVARYTQGGRLGFPNPNKFTRVYIEFFPCASLPLEN